MRNRNRNCESNWGSASGSGSGSGSGTEQVVRQTTSRGLPHFIAAWIIFVICQKGWPNPKIKTKTGEKKIKTEAESKNSAAIERNEWQRHSTKTDKTQRIPTTTTATTRTRKYTHNNWYCCCRWGNTLRTFGELLPLFFGLRSGMGIGRGRARREWDRDRERECEHGGREKRRKIKAKFPFRICCALLNFLPHMEIPKVPVSFFSLHDVVVVARSMLLSCRCRFRFDSPCHIGRQLPAAFWWRWFSGFPFWFSLVVFFWKNLHAFAKLSFDPHA